MTSRYRRALPFHVHLVGEEFRLTSNTQLSEIPFCRPSSGFWSQFRPNGSHHNFRDGIPPVSRNVFLFSMLVLVAHLHTSFLRFSFILVYFNNRWGASSMDAPLIVSRRTSGGAIPSSSAARFSARNCITLTLVSARSM